jgi:hypothetical protein
MKNISRKQAIKQAMLFASAMGSTAFSRSIAARTIGRTVAARNFKIASLANPQRTAWMAGNWGIMTHWIAPGPGLPKGKRFTDLNQAVDHFDVTGFVKQFEQAGARHLIFTVGQNSTYYASPNVVMDKYMGPGHCSKRDLILEVASAVKAKKKRFIAYLPGEIRSDTTMHEAFKWNIKNQHEFEKRYTEFIRAYSLQWGENIDGWWFDGCYNLAEFFVPRNWQLWCDVSRAGNKDAVVAFNDGSFVAGYTQPLTPLQDYLSGECSGIRNGRIAVYDDNDPHKKSILPSHYVAGTHCQFHVLMPIDLNGGWGNDKDGPMPPPRYSDSELFPFVHRCLRAGAAVTLNVGIYQDGHLSQQTLDQLTRLAAYLKK